MKNKNIKLKGVTLIELAVVVAIIMLLVLVVSVVFFQTSDRAVREDSLIALHAIAKAMRMYKLTEGDYPIRITPYLQSYVNLTRMQSRFTGNNVTIYRNGSAVCVSGINWRIDPVASPYYVNYCVESGTTVRTLLTNQPSCCWSNVTTCSLDSTNDANWYYCGSRL